MAAGFDREQMDQPCCGRARGQAVFIGFTVQRGSQFGVEDQTRTLGTNHAPGLSITERLHTIAPHPLATLRMTDMVLPEAALIGNAGEGFKVAMAVLDVFRSTVGAAALGFARRALDETVARVKTRRIQGAALAEMQMVQGHIADMAVRIDAAALLVYRAAWVKDSGAPRVTREAAMAKLYATEVAQAVIDMAVQMHGADGVRSGSVVERLYREIRALRIYEGASDVQRMVIARAVLGG